MAAANRRWRVRSRFPVFLHEEARAPATASPPCASAAAAQYETRLALDHDRAGALFEKQIPEGLSPNDPGTRGFKPTPKGDAPDILKNALTVQSRSSSPIALVMFAFRVSRGRVVSRFESRPFTVRPGTAVAIGDASLPQASIYGEKLAAGSVDFVTARSPIPAEEGIRYPERHIANGIFFNKPADWAQLDAM